MPYKDPEARRAASKRWQLANLDRNKVNKQKQYLRRRPEILARSELYREENSEIINKQRQQYRDNNKKLINDRAKIDYKKRSKQIKVAQAIGRHKLKIEVLMKYGGLRCALCPEERIGALQVDHIYGGGCQHRKTLKTKGIVFYRWLKKSSYPSGYRVLCANCNHKVICRSPLSQHPRAVESRQRYYKLKETAIKLLGGCCKDCQMIELNVLTIHHKNHDGGKHRQLAGQNGVYLDIIKHRHSINIECLCFSCHFVRHSLGSNHDCSF